MYIFFPHENELCGKLVPIKMLSREFSIVIVNRRRERILEEENFKMPHITKDRKSCLSLEFPELSMG